MGIESLRRRHADQIAGVVSCYGRLLIFGTLAAICFAKGMTSCLYEPCRRGRLVSVLEGSSLAGDFGIGRMKIPYSGSGPRTPYVVLCEVATSRAPGYDQRYFSSNSSSFFFSKDRSSSSNERLGWCLSC